VEGPNAGNDVCAVFTIGVRPLRRPQIRQCETGNPWQEGAKSLTIDESNAAYDSSTVFRAQPSDSWKFKIRYHLLRELRRADISAAWVIYAENLEGACDFQNSENDTLAGNL
jgi:hypothetical protein